MKTPIDALQHFAIALAIGAGLGVFYGFLRPLRRHHHWPADLIFIIGFFWGWLHLAFGVCRGDIRLGCSIGIPLGVLLWDKTVGRWLRPLFDGFWRLIGKILRAIFYPLEIFFKKIGKTVKFLLAIVKKRLQ